MRLLGLISFLSFSLCTTASAEVRSSLWNVKKSEHFIVYYRDAPSSYVGQVIEKAEAYYDAITGELGFTRYGGFWTWDERAKIYVYNTKEDYSRETKHSGWSASHVDVVTREMYTYIDMDNFFDIILPHELGHVIFREFVGHRRQLPLWLDEGIVSYLEKKQSADRMLVAKAVLKTTYFSPLEELTEARPGLQVMPDVFYAEAASIIEFLVAVYGKGKLLELCKALRDLRHDKGWFVAFQEVYGFRDIDEMNEKWIKFLEGTEERR